MMTRYNEQLLGPALPTLSPDSLQGNLIRNRSILKQVKSDVKRMEREKVEEEEIRRVMEGEGVTSLIKDLLKYEMSEVPNINSNLQNFAGIQNKKGCHKNHNDTTTINHQNGNARSKSTKYQQPSNNFKDEDNQFRSISTDIGNGFVSLSNRPENADDNFILYTCNHHLTGFKTSSLPDNSNGISPGTPRSHRNYDTTNSIFNNSQNKSNASASDKNSDNNIVTVTTPRKAYEDVIRKMEFGSILGNQNDNGCKSVINQNTACSVSSPRSHMMKGLSSVDAAAMVDQPIPLLYLDKVAKAPFKQPDSTIKGQHYHPNEQLSLHCIVKNAQKIACNQLKNQHYDD